MRKIFDKRAQVSWELVMIVVAIFAAVFFIIWLVGSGNQLPAYNKDKIDQRASVCATDSAKETYNAKNDYCCNIISLVPTSGGTAENMNCENKILKPEKSQITCDVLTMCTPQAICSNGYFVLKEKDCKDNSGTINKVPKFDLAGNIAPYGALCCTGAKNMIKCDDGTDTKWGVVCAREKCDSKVLQGEDVFMDVNPTTQVCCLKDKCKA